MSHKIFEVKKTKRDENFMANSMWQIKKTKNIHMKHSIALLLFFYMLSSCSQKHPQAEGDYIIANGQMPNVAKDKNNSIHLVYGSGDSIMYCNSSDNAKTFSKPSLISVLPNVYAFAMRGPQIAAAKQGIVVTACTSSGDIYSFYKNVDGNWMQGKKVNDADTVAKEGLMALSADGNNAFAVWLDLRSNQRNKIYGAKSIDGGKTWSKNILIYASPDSSVCECCKPSVAVKGNNVYVMFRNWLNGNRDLYLVQSNNAGNSFGEAQKLGIGSWQLNGCPMDGGGLALNAKGEVQTVWRRKANVFAAMPGMPEKEIGEGKSCTIETANDKNVYAWMNNKGEIVCLLPNGTNKIIGKGSLPLLKSVGDNKVVCVWQDERQIKTTILNL